MLNKLSFPVTFDIILSGVDSSGIPLISQSMLRGESPVETIHCTDVDWPASNGSSPKENGKIFGGTNQLKFMLQSVNIQEFLQGKNVS